MKGHVAVMVLIASLINNAALAQEDASIQGAWEWENGGWVFTLLPGKYAVGTLDNVAMAVYEYRISGQRLYIRDLTPPPNAEADERQCVTQNEAVYRFLIKDDKLTLSVIEDPCEGRAEAFTAAGYFRIGMPTY